MNSLSTPIHAEIFLSAWNFHPRSSMNLGISHSISFPLRPHSTRLSFTPNFRKKPTLLHRPRAIFGKSDTKSSSSSSSSQSDNVGNTIEEDFVTRVLKENPSQVEPRYLIGDRLYTLKEKEELRRNSLESRFFEILEKLKSVGGKKKKSEESGVRSEAVYLKDILKEHRGKLYVPEKVLAENLSEEEEFDREFESLPKLRFEDFGKYLEHDKVKFLTLKEKTYASNLRDFIVELKEVPGEKSLQRTKWAIKLDGKQAQAVLEEYSGPRYEIEQQTTSWVGKLPEYPHPVASSISTRMISELGMLTAVMGAAAAVVGGYIASAVLAVTTFVFAVAVFFVWPLAKPFVKFFIGLASGILEKMWDNLVDMFDDGIAVQFYNIITFGKGSASFRMLIPLIATFTGMALVVRFTISRKPKNFRRWDIWQGMEFSQSKPQARVDGSTGVTFKDVAGIEEAVEELQELVRYLKNPELFDKMGIKPPHGVLLEGPPGCGKTLVAKAIAGEAGVPFYQMAGSEFVEVLVGVGSARIRDLFKRAKVNKPSVIFIDEIDALGTRRQGIFNESTEHTYNAATQEKETTLNQLLIELDGFDTGKGVIFLGATNRRDLLDPALLRPGRFDRKIRIRPPNAKGRLEILKVHGRKVKLSDSVDLSTYAQNLPGWSGAKLAQLLQEAALVAIRNGHNSILSSDMDDAVDRLTIGPKRSALELSHQGQCRRATTEVGTAMTAHLLRQFENANVERCDRISINPRGQTLSQVIFHRLDDESCMFERKPQLLHRLQVFLGGRAAEEVIFGRDTSMASADYLADASWLAHKIITVWNLENPMVIQAEPPPWRNKVRFVGPRRDFEGKLYNVNGLIQRPINLNLDDDVSRRTEKLMCDMYGATVALLRRHHAALLKTVKVLVTKMEISGEEIDFIVNNYPAHTPASRILEETDPGALPFFKQEQQEGSEMEYNLLST